jgi:Tfp pilus assembly protein PilN
MGIRQSRPDEGVKIVGRAQNEDPRPKQPSPLNAVTMSLWLLAAGMLIFFVPLFLVVSSLRDNIGVLDANLQSNRVALTAFPTALPNVKALQTTLSQLLTQTQQITVAYSTVVAPRTDWSSILSLINSNDPAQIALTSLSRADSRLTLSGRALSEDSVAVYARSLEQSDLFARVVVQSIQPSAGTTGTVPATAPGTPGASATNTPAPSPSPSLTGTPVLSSTPTVNPRDQYEPDDVNPRLIFPGQPQHHNFYPSGDVDKVTFTAKAGRTYRVLTADLGPGVDTTLTVRVGDTTLTNDDAVPGTLASQVDFQNTSADLSVLIIVTNRGQYGADRVYTLEVDEIIPTPTSTGTATPTPTSVPSATPSSTPTDTPSATPSSTSTVTPSATPSSTSTRTPTPTRTPTSTPDLRDAYEPDDILMFTIVVSETQLHNFYPDGDVDRVSFTAKAGRDYQVLTSNLALGVDTILTVTVPGHVYVNDDYSSSPGNYASAVCFTSTVESLAVVKIANVSHEYGPDKLYKVSVFEVAAVPTAPCNPTSALQINLRGAGLAAPAEPKWLAGPGVRLGAPQVAMPLTFVINLDLKAPP